MIIVDLDGTIADDRHRKGAPAASAVHLDEPIANVIAVVKVLIKEGHQLWVVTARSAALFDHTMRWLHAQGLEPSQLLMRPVDISKDVMPDYVLKKTWISKGKIPAPADVLAVFEDKKSCIKMYRAAGYTVLACREPVCND
jgi:hypothetical protein